MSSIFDFISTSHTEETVKEKKDKKSPFAFSSEIYKIIKSRSENYKDDLDKLFKEFEENDFNFICWILNHNLVYNKVLRTNPDWFTGLVLLMTHREYVYYYVKFMIDNNIKFPDFMSWYKMGIDNADKHYIHYLKEIKQFSEEEIDELTTYANEYCMSIKDICFNLETLDNIIIRSKGDIF